MTDGQEPMKEPNVDPAQLRRAMLTELYLEPIGRILMGTLTLGALVAMEKALNSSATCQDLDLIRALFGATVRVPADEMDWEGRKLSESELREFEEGTLSRFAELFLVKKEWQTESFGPIEDLGTSIATLSGAMRRRIREVNEKFKKDVQVSLGPMKDVFSDATQRLFRESEKLGSLFRNAYAPISQLGAIDPAKTLASRWKDSGIQKLMDSMREVEGKRPVFPILPPAKLVIPQITPIHVHVDRLSADLGRVIESLERLTDWTSTTNRMVTSALSDITKWRGSHEKSSRVGLWIAVAGIAVTTIISSVTLLYSIHSGRSGGVMQERQITALQEQNQILKSILDNQKSALINAKRSESEKQGVPRKANGSRERRVLSKPEVGDSR